jgi:hypothetical protein
VDSKKKYFATFTRKSQGKQKGEGNRIKIDKNSDKTKVVGFFRFPLFTESIVEWREV